MILVILSGMYVSWKTIEITENYIPLENLPL